MFHVYVIQTVDSERKIYIGCSRDVKRRLREHNTQGSSGYTHNKKWRLVYCESYLSETDARERERKLKHDGRSKYQMMKRISGSLAVN